MRSATAGAIGGLTAGVILSAVMVIGRRAGLLYETLAERSEAWLDETFATRNRLGAWSTTILEQANHAAASVGFGIAYGSARRYFPGLHPVVGGAMFGAGLYTVNIAGIAPLIGITRGEWRERGLMAFQRLGMHLLYGITTAVATDALSKPSQPSSARYDCGSWP
ncbi:MAG: hypothetical protein AB7O13_03390 [Alphaproteobacteria bacterium]